MKVIKQEVMQVNCSRRHAMCESTSLDDFREIGHTYPPTVYFVCPSCKQESKVFELPPRLLSSLVKKISSERGYLLTPFFDNGQKVY